MSNRAFSISKKTDGLQLIKPTKGTKIEIGEMIRVEWTYASTSNTNQPIFIELLNKSGKVVQNISASSTKISDTSIQTKLNSEIVPGSYKIKAYSTPKNGARIVSESDMFDVVAKPSLVTVTAPAANAKVRIGNTLTARWSVKTLPMNLHGYDVYIIDTVTNKKQRIASVSKINSSYIWTPPINGIVGSGDGAIWGIGDTDTKKYKIEVHMVDVSGVSIGSDQSDSAFSIVR
ncbi:MAG: hypothetical protein FGM57_01860 [Candidatus Taylorbacteria bacterium]|nr:hypothetical protein [Candidatus Taylorbacteria bacterium]